MHPYMNKKEDRIGSGFIVDPWAPYRGKYPDPTPVEFNLIRHFLFKFAFDDDDFVEDKNESWISLKNRLRCPNLRWLLIKFLRQVRESKGYDVDLSFDFLDSVSPWYAVFVPRRLDDNELYDEAMAASKLAIGKINAHMMTGGKSYELVSVDKLVSTTNMLLLTFTAKEIDADADAVVETFQAMVHAKKIDGDANTNAVKTPSSFHLKEWKFKPVPIRRNE